MRQSCKIVANLFQWSEVRLLGNPSAFIHTLNLRVMVMVGHHESLVLGKSVAKVERTKGGKYLDNWTRDKVGDICIWNGIISMAV